MNAQIGEYDIVFIILDLGLDVNILTKKTCESMWKPKLVWSLFQLRLANQLKFLPIGRLPQVPVEVEGLRTYAKFEVIEIVDDMDPYPALTEIIWDIGNQTVINFKKRTLSLED